MVVGISGVGAKGISKEPEKNTAAIAAAEAMKLINRSEGVELKIDKGIKPDELKKNLFLRIYGNDFDKEIKDCIVAKLYRHKNLLS